MGLTNKVPSSHKVDEGNETASNKRKRKTRINIIANSHNTARFALQISEIVEVSNKR